MLTELGVPLGKHSINKWKEKQMKEETNNIATYRKQSKKWSKITKNKKSKL